MIFPAAPVVYNHKSQLKGLEKNEFILQPKWDGRRAISIPGKEMVYKSGKPVIQKPWKDLNIPRVNAILDLELFRDRSIVLDIIEDIPLYKRLEKIKSFGLEVMYFEISSVEEINVYLRKCLTSGLCDGVVLKRKDAGYAISERSQIDYKHWVKVKQIIL